MSVQHTSGPWSFSRRGLRIYGGQTSNVAVANVVVNPGYEGNGALLAAAPDLVDALIECLDLIEDMSRFAGQMALQDYERFNLAPIAGRLALAKAAGK